MIDSHFARAQSCHVPVAQSIDAWRNDRKFNPASFRASGRWQRFAVDLASPSIAPIRCCACPRPIAMSQCRFGRNGANSETRGAIGWCGGASTAALAPRTALRDVVDRMVGDGDERVSRPLGRLRGRAPLGGLLACAHRLEPCAGGGPSCGIILALPSIRRLPCSLNVQAALSLPWARSFALGHRAWSTRWPNPAPPCPACRATGRAA